MRLQVCKIFHHTKTLQNIFHIFLDDEFLYLVKGDVVALSDNSNLENKTAVIETMLFSELAADAKMFPTASEWFNYYKTVMGETGWVEFSSTQFKEFIHESNNNKSNLHEIGIVVVQQISKMSVGEELSSKLTYLFNGLLKAGPESQEVALFTEGRDEIRKNFFLAGVADGHDEDTTLALVAIELNVDLSSAQILFCQANNFDYKVATYAAELNKDIFEAVEETIETRLGGRLQTDVSPVSGSNTTDPTTPLTCSVSSSPSAFHQHLQISILTVLCFLYKIIA